jgi:hypothetical protein
MCRQRFDERAFEKGNHRGDNRREGENVHLRAARSAIWRAGFALLAGGLISLGSMSADESPAVARAWLEAKAMHTPIALPIDGAQRTEIAFGTLGEDGLEPFAKGAVEANGELFVAAREAAAADLATLAPRYVRDRRKVIQYAELSSMRPIVASAVLAPKFLAQFHNTLGDSVLVVVPSRYTAFVFPQLASRYQEYYPLVFEAYRATAYPVSVELFEFSVRGIRAMGVFDEK